jgi:hypothetical protein
MDETLLPGLLQKHTIMLGIIASVGSRSQPWDSLGGGRFNLSPTALPDHLFKILEPHTFYAALK